MEQKNVWFKTFVFWLPLAAVMFVLSLLVYTAVQQNYRMSANDPQIQVAEDVAASITSGATPADSIVPPNPTADMSSSLSAFLIVYSATGTPIGGSVALDGKIPSMPTGVADYVKLHGEDRFTWQPKSSVRAAVVVTSFSGPQSGFILVGRSLKEIEIREGNLLKICGVAMLLGWIVIYFLIFFLLKLINRPAVPETPAEIAVDETIVMVDKK